MNIVVVAVASIVVFSIIVAAVLFVINRINQKKNINDEGRSGGSNRQAVTGRAKRKKDIDKHQKNSNDYDDRGNPRHSAHPY